MYSCGLFLFFSLSRLGSTLPKSEKQAKRETTKYLTRDRVDTRESDFVVLSFLHTKTVQFGQRILRIPLIRSDSPLCPVAAYRHTDFLLNATHTAAFAYRQPNGKVRPLLSHLFVTTLRQILRRAGIPGAHLYRGHSFRRGGASWAFDNGVPGELIQVMGDWKSDAYKTYLEFSLHSKVAIAQRLVKNLPVTVMT